MKPKEKHSDIKYEIIDDGATIVYKGTGEVTKEHAVHAYRRKKIIFSEGITSIAPHAFRQVSAPAEGEEKYFEYEEVELPRSLETIGSWAFVSVITRLKKFRFCEYRPGVPESEITEEELENYYSLRSIGGAALMMNYYLTDMYIPATFLSIEDSLFAYVPLKTIRLNSKIKNIGKNAFHYCPELTEISLPSGVNSIGTCAFAHCPKLAKINWENSVSSFIGSNAFEYSTSLEEFTFPPTAELYSAGSFFVGCTSLKKCILPVTLTVLTRFEKMFQNCINLVEFTLPENIKNIGAQMFANFSSIEYCFFPETVTWIDAAVFYDCVNLRYVNIPIVGNIYMGNNIFYNTPNLELLVVRGNLTRNLASYMFGGKTFCYFGLTNYISSDHVVPDYTKIYVTKEFSEMFYTFGENVTYPYGSFYGYPYQVITDEETCKFPGNIFTPPISPLPTFTPSQTATESVIETPSFSPSYSPIETPFQSPSESPSPSLTDSFSPSKSVTVIPSSQVTAPGTNTQQITDEPGLNQDGKDKNKSSLMAWHIALIAIGSSVVVGFLCAIGIFLFMSHIYKKKSNDQYNVNLNTISNGNLEENLN